MDYSEIVEEAWRTLFLNKMRTGLAMLGIIIGIGSVIALISLGQGSQKAINNQINSLGANLLTISPGSQKGGFVQGGSGSATTLTLDDATAIGSSSQVTTVSSVSPEYSRRTQVTTGGKNTNTSITGVTPTYSGIHKVTIASGSFISRTYDTSFSSAIDIADK